MVDPKTGKVLWQRKSKAGFFLSPRRLSRPTSESSKLG
jgi:outer membrane protein assembly factor BamB